MFPLNSSIDLLEIDRNDTFGFWIKLIFHRVLSPMDEKVFPILKIQMNTREENSIIDLKSK